MRSLLRSSALSNGSRAGSPARRRTAAAPPSGYRVEKAYRHLKTQIMSATLPPGASLNEQEIAAARLGTSRTSVREAIRKLEQEGLAMRYPNRGAILTKLSMTEVLEIWQLREILEPAACGLAAGRIDRAALADLERRLADLKRREVGPEAYEAFLQADVSLHSLVVDSTANQTLRQLMHTLNRRITQVRVVTSPARFRSAVDEHLTIVAALQARDAGREAEAMRRHLASARQALVTLA